MCTPRHFRCQPVTGTDGRWSSDRAARKGFSGMTPVLGSGCEDGSPRCRPTGPNPVDGCGPHNCGLAGFHVSADRAVIADDLDPGRTSVEGAQRRRRRCRGPDALSRSADQQCRPAAGSEQLGEIRVGCAGAGKNRAHRNSPPQLSPSRLAHSKAPRAIHPQRPAIRQFSGSDPVSHCLDNSMATRRPPESISPSCTATESVRV